MPTRTVAPETVTDEGKRITRSRNLLLYVLWGQALLMSFAPPVTRNRWWLGLTLATAILTILVHLHLKVSLRRFLRRVQIMGAPEAVTIGDAVDERERHHRRVQKIVAAGDNITIVYQPIVDLDTWIVAGYEALSRFVDGRPPDQWFAEAAELGLGVELEMLAISRAIPHAPAKGYLSLNVSCPTLLSSGFADFIRERANERIVIELTEHSAIADYDVAGRVIDALRASGARLAVDDAGGGYASMRHIVILRPDLIKLDRSLVSDLHQDHSKREMARLLARFAESTGAVLIAEGIETAEELNACRDLGIHLGQGYLLGPPEPQHATLPSLPQAHHPADRP